jgi:hypothetical protein
MMNLSSLFSGTQTVHLQKGQFPTIGHASQLTSLQRIELIIQPMTRNGQLLLDFY